WSVYAQNPDSSTHLFNSTQGAGTTILTFLGGFHPQTQSLWLTDIAHHHLAIAVKFWMLMFPQEVRLGRGHKGLYDTVNNSLHFQLGLALAALGDYTTQAALYTHHQYIAGFIMAGAFAHGAIFFIRDYDPEQNKDNVLARIPASNAGQSLCNLLFLTIGPGDFLVHHAIALGLHTTTLILVKGALDARGSKLMPDKKEFGGTCDISAWDAFYLVVFWMLNTIGWGNAAQFNESSTYLMGWLRDYLWLNSSQLINGYNPFGMNSLSIWAWMFLFGHLVWATGFMFLISWCGYWQELIETLAWAHERTPLANVIGWKDKPVALSIVQARLVGLAHFSVGYVFTKRQLKNSLRIQDKLLILEKLQSLPQNSAPSRLHNRCSLTG
ncbi:hypothetical protein KP509_1Z022700, partial [Ceratopteris richardii]